MPSAKQLGFVTVLLALLATACGRVRAPRSIVLVTVSGWPASTETSAASERIDGVSEGLDTATATVASTDVLASEASLQTGVLPARHGLRGAAAAEILAPTVRTLAEAAKAAGLRTSAFVASPSLRPGSGLDRGFDSWSDGGGTSGLPRPPQAVMKEVLDRLASRPRDGADYIWVQLDASDDSLELGQLDAVAAAIVGLRAAVASQGAAITLAIAGSLGEHRGAALAGERARVVSVAWPRSNERLPEACATSLLSTARRLALVAGLGDFACEAVTTTESFALARRFGLPAIASDSPTLPTISLPSDLAGTLGDLALPSPPARRNQVRSEPPDSSSMADAIIDQEVAQRRLQAGHLASAKALFERALTVDPLALEAIIETARIEVRDRQLERAAMRLSAALPSYTARPEVFHALSHVQFLLGDHRTALAAARVAFAMEPNDPEIAFDVSADLAGLGRADEALAQLGQAVALGFRDAQLLTNLPVFVPLHSDSRFREIVTRLRNGA